MLQFQFELKTLEMLVRLSFRKWTKTFCVETLIFPRSTYENRMLVFLDHLTCQKIVCWFTLTHVHPPKSVGSDPSSSVEVAFSESKLKIKFHHDSGAITKIKDSSNTLELTEHVNKRIDFFRETFLRFLESFIFVNATESWWNLILSLVSKK